MPIPSKCTISPAALRFETTINNPSAEFKVLADAGEIPGLRTGLAATAERSGGSPSADARSSQAATRVSFAAAQAAVLKDDSEPLKDLTASLLPARHPPWSREGRRQRPHSSPHGFECPESPVPRRHPPVDGGVGSGDSRCPGCALPGSCASIWTPCRTPAPRKSCVGNRRLSVANWHCCVLMDF